MIRAIRREDLRSPTKVIEIELSEIDPSGLQSIDVEGYVNLWCLSRRHGIPQGISFWQTGGERHIEVSTIVALLSRSDDDNRIAPGAEATSAKGLDVTVAICTHDRPNGLSRALNSLSRQSDTRFTTIVVDNAPRSTISARVVEASSLPDCDYLIEPEKGLSRARNTALAHVTTPYVAWIDDDELADVDWMARIKQGFAHESSPAAVCGIMLPAELETEAQVRFEQYGGFNKGRGLSSEVLTANSSSVLSPLYPLPAIGSGGNMAFRMESLRNIGGFDRSLGAGTKTHGGEETRVFCSLLRLGESVLHWPNAITWHFHRREMDQLHAQFYGYSAGLSAFYASMIRTEPGIVWEILRLAPHALRDLGLRDGGIKTDQLPADFPKSLIAAGRKGLLAGALSYVSEALHDGLGGWRA
jgi:glycosyltransferase involved in cell wall biosynthesis